MTDLKCPECESEITLRLVKSTIQYKRPPGPVMIGGPPRGYNIATKRTITWDCTNKECEQRKGFPKPPPLKRKWRC